MTYTIRKSKPARHWLITPLVALEERALMTASALTKYAFVPVQAEVASPATPHVAKPATHATHASPANVHASVTTHSMAAHSSTAQKAKSATVSHTAQSQAKTHFNPLSITNYVKSRLVTRRALVSGNPIPGAFGPVAVAKAYGVSALPVANQGQGQTIGIVDVYDDTNIISDANSFSSYYGLQKFNVTGGPTMTVFKDTAIGPVGSAAGTGVATETSLDVEWAHSMAPKANILLVEVPAGNSLVQEFQFLFQGIQYAANHGASVVSLSYGFHEASNSPGNTSFGLPALYSLDHTYLSVAPTTNVALTISTGDTSYPGFPGTSPNIIGVGGTALFVTSTNDYAFETAWGGPATNGAGGGGPSAFFRTPTYQSSNGINYGGHRNLPDVSLLADPATAVSVYNSLDANTNGGNPWTAVGGTSLASPLFAGMLSIAQQGRVAASKPILTSAQINGILYGLYNSPSYLTYFHDITRGNNSDLPAGYAGYTASTGYDQATGIGSPIANTLIPYLVSV